MVRRMFFGIARFTLGGSACVLFLLAGCGDSESSADPGDGALTDRVLADIASSGTLDDVVDARSPDVASADSSPADAPLFDASLDRGLAPDVPVVDVAAPPDLPAADACSAGPSPASEGLTIGFADSNANMFTNPGFDRFFVSTRGVAHRRIAHVYTHWNVALLPATDGERIKLQTWLDRAACHGVEPMVTFTPAPGAALPVPAEYDQAFVRFRAAWPQVLAFTAWNEPNGPDSWPDNARAAADIYLRALTHCRPGSGCVVAAGDMAATVAGRTVGFVMESGPDAPCGRASCSWLDRYKSSIDADSATYGFPHHRPAYWAVHNWADTFNYQRNGSHCGGSTTSCVTAAFLASIQGTWGRAEVWMTEVGGVLEGASDAARLMSQECAGRFLQRLFATDPRITRWYYYSFAGTGATGDSGACPFVSLDRGECFAASGTSTRPVFDALRDRVSASLPGCP